MKSKFYISFKRIVLLIDQFDDLPYPTASHIGQVEICILIFVAINMCISHIPRQTIVSREENNKLDIRIAYDRS